MASSFRPQILGGFKRIMRAREYAFRGDKMMLDAGRQQLREEFFKYKDEDDPNKL
ncbi:unnamed protein product, partial [Sphacelaria rigidula]